MYIKAGRRREAVAVGEKSSRLYERLKEALSRYVGVLARRASELAAEASLVHVKPVKPRPPGEVFAPVAGLGAARGLEKRLRELEERLRELLERRRRLLQELARVNAEIARLRAELARLRGGRPVYRVQPITPPEFVRLRAA